MLTVWEYLSNLDPAKRARLIMCKATQLQCEYAKTEMDAVDIADAIEDDMAEWFKALAKDAFGVK